MWLWNDSEQVAQWSEISCQVLYGGRINLAESMLEWLLTAGWLRVTEFILMLGALVLVPLFYVSYRKEKYRDPEGDYPDPSMRPLPDWESDDPFESGYPTASASGFGRVNTTPGTYLSYLIYKYAWRHPDVQYYQEYLRMKRERSKRK